MDSGFSEAYSFVNIECAAPKMQPAPLHIPSVPARAVARTYPAVPQRGESIELERIRRHSSQSGGSSVATSSSSIDTPDLEMSRPGSPAPDSVQIVPSISDPQKNRWRFLAICLMSFANGMNDSAPGALIPYMEKYYDIGYGIVSLVFVGNAIGFITAALFLDGLRKQLGRAKTLALAEMLIAAAYIPIMIAAPFPVIVISFFVIGFGMSINIAMGNIFCGSLQNGTTLLGGMHGAYGLGGTIGPLVATAIVTVADAVWSRYYILTMGLTVLNAAIAGWSFRGYESDSPQPHQPLAPNAGGEGQVSPRVSGDLFTTLSSRIVLLGAVFIFAYQGAEVSISGWVISFLITTRDGDPSRVGYVTAGFWAGITLGRFLLTSPAHQIGEKLFVYVTVAGAALFELLVWLVPNVIGDAVAVAIVGLFLGPVYPCAVAVFMRCLSRREQISAMGVISAFGSSGGAAAPFTTGILAQAVGTFVLHPIAMGLFGLMLCCWYGIPNRKRRLE